LIANEIEFDSADPGLFTVKLAAPLWLTSDAGIATVRSAESTNVVVRSAPFHITTAPGTNPDPVIASTTFPLPAVTLDGVAEVNPGVALTVFHGGNT